MACKDSEPVPAKTKTELITAHDWIMESGTITPSVNGESDYTKLVKECILDDYIVLKSDGTGSSNNGDQKCDPSDPQETNFTWNFNSDETSVILKFGAISQSFEITELTASVFKAKSEAVIEGIPVTLDAVFVPKK